MRWTLAVAILAMALPAGGATPEERCADAVAQAGRKLFDRSFAAIARCENARARGRLGQEVVCRPADGAVTDARTASALERARAGFEKKVGKRCGGADAAALALGVPCGGAFATLDERVACLADEAYGAFADALVETAFGPAADVPVAERSAQKCRGSIAKETSRYASSRLGLRASCEKRLVAGQRDSCPDERTFAKLDRGREKLGRKVSARCTDAELTGDPPLVDLGFPCDGYEVATFRRVPGTNDNALSNPELAVRCLLDAAARAADRGAEAARALPDPAPFSLGVAAGDATQSAFVAWTRVDGGGEVTLEVATDPEFASLVASEVLLPDAAADQTVKADVAGLAAGTPYWYRFRQGAATSRTGRVRTAPAAGGPIRFAFSGDSNAATRPFHSLEPATRSAPDLFLYIGDIVYADSNATGTGVATVRSEYHVKYRENRGDRSLRDLLASAGTVAVWDDHEVRNDFWGTDPGVAAQMGEGSQALRDYLPIREDGADPMRLYRSFRWGDVAEFFVLDDRQYRDPPAWVVEPACLDGASPATLPTAPACTAALEDPARTYLGAAQLAWLQAGLQASTATWKFLLNGPPVSRLLFLPFDRWDGYAGEREALLDFIETEGVGGVIFLSTDFHTGIVNDDVGAGVRELVAGPIGTGTLFRALPASVFGLVGSLPTIFQTLSFGELDRFHVVNAVVSAEQAAFEYRDASGQLLERVVVPAP